MHPQTVADVIRTCLGPKAMLKMILDPMGGILYVLGLHVVFLQTGYLMVISFLSGSQMTGTPFYEKSTLHIQLRRT